MCELSYTRKALLRQKWLKGNPVNQYFRVPAYVVFPSLFDTFSGSKPFLDNWYIFCTLFETTVASSVYESACGSSDMDASNAL